MVNYSLHKGKCKDILDYILENLEKKQTIKLLAAHFGTSEMTMRRTIKQCFNYNVHRLILELRMSKAMNLLMETDLPIKTIAESVGYSYKQGFANAFKDFFKQSPGRIRRKRK